MSRRSMSLSPIRTESGANLRTAHWTRMKFKQRGGAGGHHFGNRPNFYNKQHYHENNRYYPNQHRNEFRKEHRRESFYDSRRSRSRSRSHHSSRSSSWSSGHHSPVKNLNQSKPRDLLEPSKWDSPQERNGNKNENKMVDVNKENQKKIKIKPKDNEYQDVFENKKRSPQLSNQANITPAPKETSMTVVDPSGKLVTMTFIEMVGPDGKLMKVLQMPKGPPATTAPPVAMVTSPLVTTSPDLLGEKVDRSKYEAEKLELEEKQRRRKEVIRTRLWPRPATWKDKGNPDTKESKDLTWALNPKNKNNVIPGLGGSPKKEENENETVGRKIPTLGNTISYPAIKINQNEYVRKVDQNVESNENVAQQEKQQNKNYQQPFQQTAYPNISQGFSKPRYISSVVPTVAEVHPPEEVQLRHQVAEVRQPVEDLRTPVEDLRHPVKDLRHPVENLRHPVEDLRHPVEGLRHPVASKWESPDITKIQQRSHKSFASHESSSSDGENKSYKPEAVVEVECSSDENLKKKKKKKKQRKLSTSESKKKKKKKKKELSEEKNDKKLKKQKLEEEEKIDHLIRNIPADLPLSHIRDLVVRNNMEGGQSIFSHIPNLSKSTDSYETQFVSLFGGSEDKQSPLMSRKSLKKTKITVTGSRSVTHMTKLSLSERITKAHEEKKMENEKVMRSKQTVSVNLESLNFLKMGKENEKSHSRSPLRHSRSKQRSLSGSRSMEMSTSPMGAQKISLDRSRSNQRSLNRSNSNQRSLERSRSPKRSPVRRSRSKSLPRAYNDQRQRSSSKESVPGRWNQNRDRGNSRSPQRVYQQRNYNHYNQRFRGRGGGFRGRWNNHQNYFHNRGRGYQGNNWRGRFQNNYYDNNRPRPNFNLNNRDKRFNRSKTRSYSRSRSPIHSPPKKNMKISEPPAKEFFGKRKPSPKEWTHDKFEENEKSEPN